MTYSEDEYLQLSGIQHFEFCRRQWALIHIEQQWDENYLTASGTLLHKNAHDSGFVEKRGNVIITRAMPVYSRTLGISGECDVVEFMRDEKNGVELFGRDGRYQPVPVEYKRGDLQEADIYQLTAQAMWLEEMLCCVIGYGYIYHMKSKRRERVDFTEERRRHVSDALAEMHSYYKRRYTPKVKTTKSCSACSLKNICIPKLNKITSAKEYIKRAIREDEQ